MKEKEPQPIDDNEIKAYQGFDDESKGIVDEILSACVFGSDGE
jgi:hypothetical protein